jgi:hypothetical protein
VTPDDAKKLIGGYATGSLSETERKLLFEAALEDQDLFDQLAHEQGLKELLDEPGAKQRLIAALGPSQPRAIPWWKRPVTWTAAGVVAAGLAVLSWTIFHAPKPMRIAQVSTPAPPPAPVDAPVGVPEVKATPAPARQKKAVPPRTNISTGTIADRKEPSQPADTLIAPAAAPLPPKEQENQVKVQASQAQVQAGPNQIAVQPAAGFTDSAGAQNSRKKSSQASAFRMATPLLRARFGFDYTVDGQTLVLRFAAAGYISIHFSPGGDTIVGSPVAAGSTRRDPIPNNATEASIVFTALPQTTTGGVSLNRDNRSGTVNDPAGARIELLLRIY